MSRYRELIMQATGYTAKQAAQIEDTMRNVIFHSTLDWQTRDELQKAARLAFEVVKKFKRPVLKPD